VKQRLDPFSSTDEEVRKKSWLIPEAEVEGIPVVTSVSYQSPKGHRRRPGNAFALAFRNFGVEFKVLLEFGHVHCLTERCLDQSPIAAKNVSAQCLHMGSQIR
jgi:hypothetical protein